MMHDKAIRTLSTVSIGMIGGAIAVACAGGDTPSRDDTLEGQIAAEYANGAPPPVAAAGTGAGGRGGSGGRASSTGGSGPAAAGTGAGGRAAGGAGGAMSSGGADPVGGAGTGSGGGDCNGFVDIIGVKCVGSTCHGDGSPFTGFAASEDAAVGFVGESGTSTCASEGPLIDPANPPASIIVQKVSGTPPCGSAMPIGTPLTDAEIECLEDWIGSLE